MLVLVLLQLTVFLTEGGSQNLILLLMGIAFAVWYVRIARFTSLFEPRSVSYR